MSKKKNASNRAPCPLKNWFHQTTFTAYWKPTSIDPVVFFKLQLILFFEDIRSERQLMETVNVNLAHRWYIGYDLGEAVPDHSSLSKIRSRYGLRVFQRFFEKVVELCQEAGLIWGKELYFDGSKIRANASIDGLIPRRLTQASEHVDALFVVNASTAQANPPSDELAGLVHKYDGTRRNEKRKPSYARTTDAKMSLTDPDATPMRRFNGDRAQLGYHLHYVMDGGTARIVLAALVTPASVMDNMPMLDLAAWVRTRWHVQPEIAVGDTKYGTIANIVGLEREGIRAYLPITDFSQRSPFYPAERFRYDTEHDLYVCPQGQQLTRYSRRQREEVVLYRAKSKICNRCPVKAECTASRSGRYVFRSFFQEEFDRVHAYAQTEEYKKALRKRQVWVEPLFGEAKQWHHAARFRLRSLQKVNIEGVLTAAGQNLKRLLRRKEARSGLGNAEITPIWVICFLQMRVGTLFRRHHPTFSTG